MKKSVLMFIVITVLIFVLTACDLFGDNDFNDKNWQSNGENGTTNNDFSQPAYAEDIVVNRFIIEFNSISGHMLSDIEKGNIRTKYYAYANECYVEMINANDEYAKCFSVSINGGKEINDRDRMFGVFKQVVKTLDHSISEEQINSTIEYLKSQQYMISDYKINEYVTVETYVPILEATHSKSCRIDVISTNYK